MIIQALAAAQPPAVQARRSGSVTAAATWYEYPAGERFSGPHASMALSAVHKLYWRGLAWTRRLSRSGQMMPTAVALVIGVLAGSASILFRLALAGVQSGALGFASEQVATLAAAQPWWRLLAAPALGGLVVGILVHRLMPQRRPQAVAEVIEASALSGGRMSLRVGLKAAVISATSLGVGASAGREGPVVHLGAAIGSFLARRLHLGRALRRTLLGCGVAAAVAASFNAPIAGVFFALEVVVGHYALSAFAPIVVASVTATVISRMSYGDFPAFVLPQAYEIVSFLEFPAFAFLGVVSASVAVIFMRAVMLATTVFERSHLPVWSRPALAGLAVGAVAAAGFPHVLGVGYEATDAALSELYPLWLLIALAALKTAATAACLGAGFGGGVFSPSLFLGAMTGGAFGIVATQVFPELSSGYGAYTIVGMGAVAGSVLGAPISTILMIFELTGSYELTIAVMLATVVASLITNQVHGRSFFVWQLERRGVNIRGGQEVTLLRNMRVRRLVDERFDTVGPDTPIARVRERLVDAQWGELFVVDGDGRLVGTITFHDLHEAAFDRSADDRLKAADTMRREPAVLHLEDDLDRAVRVFEASGEVHLPVVDDDRAMRLIGVAHEHELMAMYHRALVRAGRADRGEA